MGNRGIIPRHVRHCFLRLLSYPEKLAGYTGPRRGMYVQTAEFSLHNYNERLDRRGPSLRSCAATVESTGERKRKVGLALLLFPGVFVIAAALTRCIMSLSVNPNALNINRWGGRETVAGIVAVNPPILKPSQSLASPLSVVQAVTFPLLTDSCSSVPQVFLATRVRKAEVIRVILWWQETQQNHRSRTIANLRDERWFANTQASQVRVGYCDGSPEGPEFSRK